jgi:RNA polymerase sigma-70 factor (ECF subfamily)
MTAHLDDNVLSRFRQGDETAFRQVFDAFYRPLYYFTYKITGNEPEAEEICLNSFLKLYERCALFETANNIKAFLYITARNNCFDYLRTSKLQRERQQQFAVAMRNDELLAMEYDIKDELIEKVRTAINGLPEECRKIFKMLYYDELTPAEVAEILQISVSTVYNQKSRAVKSLRLTLGDHPLVITWLVLAIGSSMADVVNGQS